MPSSQPKYLHIAQEIRDKITSGALQPGDKLSTEAELSERHAAARATVRQALTLLTNEGLIRSARPSGHFVRGDVRIRYRPQQEWRPQPSSPEMDRFMTDLHQAGRKPSQTISVEIINPPPDVGERLGLTATDLVVARRRVRFLDGEPWNINDSHYPYELVKGSEIMDPTDVPRGTNQVLADLGYDQVRAIDEIEVRMPLPDEVARLDLSAGTPIALHRVTGYTADDQPIRCTINVLPGPTHVIAFERAKPEVSR
jgi:DNA-binding GntR family transcriptional regulator